MPGETRLHHQVLASLTSLAIPGYDVHVEQSGGRIDLPNERLVTGEKPAGQRLKTLCYTDAIVHREFIPRILIEVVDSSPADPNGIAGLVVNVDRIAATHPGIDLLFVVLAQIKTFYCRTCGRGHRIADPENRPCLERQLRASREDGTLGTLVELIHDGLAANYKKTLVDYSIVPYLRHIQPPSVLFLNADRAEQSWDAYQARVLDLVSGEVRHLLAAGPRSAARLLAVRELLHTLEPTPPGQ